jgi:hypothetical protein
MGLFSRTSRQAPPAATHTETRGDREVRAAREAIVSDLAGRIHDGARADQVRALPGGEEMVAEALRRAPH